jgi:hypothetical protein
MSDPAATTAQQLALVKAQLEDSAEESNRLRLQLAAAELLVQQLLRGRPRSDKLPAPEKGPPTHDNSDSSAAGSEIATPSANELAAALLSQTGTKPTPLPLPPRAEEVAKGAGSYFFAAQDLNSGEDKEPLSELRPAEEYHDPNAPLLFPPQKHARRKRKTPNPNGKHFIRDSRRSSFAATPTEDMMKTRYPMFVLPVKVLLRLERLLPHQDMLERGLLMPYNQFSMKGRIMFISHQCTRRLCAMCVLHHVPREI